MLDMGSTFDDYVERFRRLVAHEAWQRLAMDLSKNDFLALMRLHRVGESRMSDLADYLEAPLNTTTGVVARLQRRGLVERKHSPDDKRVVVATLTPAGVALMRDVETEGLAIAQRLLGRLSPEQVGLLLGVVDTVLDVLSESSPPAAGARPVRRIPID